MGTFRACLCGGEGMSRGCGGGWGRGKEVGGEGEREGGMLFMRFPLLASLWLSQRLGHCCVEQHCGTVLGTLIQLPLLAQCHFHKSKTAPKCHTGDTTPIN